MTTLHIIDVPCPDCGARSGNACFSRIRRGRAATMYHPARRMRWLWRKNGSVVVNLVELQALVPLDGKRVMVESVNRVWMFVRGETRAPNGLAVVADKADTGRWLVEDPRHLVVRGPTDETENTDEETAKT